MSFERQTPCRDFACTRSPSWPARCPREHAGELYAEQGRRRQRHLERHRQDRVEADAVYEKRDYNPRAGFNASGDLDDSLRSASIKASWLVQRKLTLSAAWLYQSRSGSPALGIGNFKANTVAINASAQF